MRIKTALLLYPSQFYCVDPTTAPIIVKTQFLKLLRHLRDQGAHVDIVDLELEFGRPNTNSECEQFLSAARKRIENKCYDFIGISCYTSMSYLSTIAVSKLARELYPKATIAVGGYHTLGKPEDFIDQKQIDFIVRGSGVKFLHALQNSLAVDRVCAFNGLSDGLKETLYGEYPYRNQADLGVAHVQLSQGCPFQCNFCCEPFVGNSTYHPLEVETALSEIDRAIHALSPRKVVIEDVIFGFNANWRYEFLTRLRERRYTQVFWLEMRVDTLTERTFALLADMNVYLTVGLEALSPATLAYMNKTSNPARYLRAFYESVELANRFDVPVTYSIILNYPGETWLSYTETMDAIDRSISDDEHGQSHIFDFYEYQFFPGNAIFQSIQKLRDECGSEVCDPEWYKRTTGDMLEMSRCRAPSKDLIDRIGESQIHSYYAGRVEQVEARCRPTNRSLLLRNWRFVERLRSRYPSERWNQIYSRSGLASVRELQQQVVRLAHLHDALTGEWIARSERAGARSWWSRNSIWNDAFEAICSRTEDPLRPDTTMQSRLMEQVTELIAEPEYAMP